MNRCGLLRSRTRIQTAVVSFLITNIGIVRTKVTGHDVQTYFSSLVIRLWCDSSHTQCGGGVLNRFKMTIADIKEIATVRSRDLKFLWNNVNVIVGLLMGYGLVINSSNEKWAKLAFWHVQYAVFIFVSSLFLFFECFPFNDISWHKYHSVFVHYRISICVTKWKASFDFLIFPSSLIFRLFLFAIKHYSII